MAERRQIIGGVESLLQESLKHVTYLMNDRGLEQNDARLTFFKHLNIILDSTSTSLILAHKYTFPKEWWDGIHNEYSRTVRRRYDYNTQRRYFDQIIMNAFFLFIFNSFEHSVRLICKHNPKLSQKNNSINKMCKGIIKELNLKPRDDFVDLITWLRNSFHNNGVYIPPTGKKGRNILFRDTTIYFKEYQPIKESGGDLWLSLIPISQAIMDLFIEMINTEIINEMHCYPDPTEPKK
jgi:hypothetical protein